MRRSNRKPALADPPAIGLGPVVMRRQKTPEEDRSAVLAWGADRIAQYTRATLDSTFLALHLRLQQPTTPAMNELLADILVGKVKVKPRPRKKWVSPEALAVFKHWHKTRRTQLEEGDAVLETFAKLCNLRLERKTDRDKAAWALTATTWGISPREAKRLYWSKPSTST